MTKVNAEGKRYRRYSDTLTNKIVDDLCKYRAQGLSIDNCAINVGMSPDTLHRMLTATHHPDQSEVQPMLRRLCQEFNRARSGIAVELIEHVRKHGDTKEKIDLLDRMFPEYRKDAPPDIVYTEEDDEDEDSEFDVRPAASTTEE